MRTLRLVLSYEGTDFQGWQSQGQGERTVQDTIEAALRQVTGEGGLSVLASGRTDTGVHALAQVASFKTHAHHSADVFHKALNAMLPHDVRVRSVEEAPETFHPQRDARSKTYLYAIANMPVASPFIRRFAWRQPRPLDIDKMQRAAMPMTGTHDFRTFMASGSSVQDTIRTLIRLNIRSACELPFLGMSISADEGCFLIIEVEGTGFLRHMVRNIVGTLVEVGTGERSAESIPMLIATGDRTLAGRTAPANGLFLKEVRY